MPLAGGTFTGDVTFDGATAGRDIVFDRSDSALEFADNAELRFGSDAANGDLQIYHNGTDNFIDTDANSLKIRVNANENAIVATSNGAVTLYHDNSTRLITTAAGVEIGGNLSTDSGSSFTINAGGASGTAASFIARCGSENAIVANANGSVDLYHDNVKTFNTEANGILVSGPEGGNAIAYLYADEGDDLADKWTVEATTNGKFTINYLNDSSAWEKSIECNRDGTTHLFHNNVNRLNTTAAGIEITGVTATDPSAVIYHSDADVVGEWLRLGRTDLGTIRYHSLKAKHGGGATSNEISFFLHNGSTTTSQTEALTLTGTGAATFGGAIYGPVKTVSALELDLSTGNYFIKTISGNSTFTFANPAASGTVTAFTLELTHSSGTVTWPSSVKWNADTAPTLTTGKTHLFMFVTDDGGTRYRGSALVDYVN
jgi:hypothetical protein